MNSKRLQNKVAPKRLSLPRVEQDKNLEIESTQHTSKPEEMSQARRLQGIDSLRWIAALIVMLGHLGTTRKEDFSSDLPYLRFLQMVAGVLFNGPAAVIIFFVISGLVIHYPQRNGRPLRTGKFYLRRYIRIGLPTLAALTLWRLVDRPIPPPGFDIFWSIICEAAYYFMYPALLSLKRRGFNWGTLLGISTVPAFILILTSQQAIRGNSDYASLGLGTIFVGLPVWISGCWIAESIERLPLISTPSLIAIRLTILSVTVLLRFVKFHTTGSAASNIYLLSLFAIPACLWVGLEVRAFCDRPPPAWLEQQGTWSFSIYLVHQVGFPLLLLIGSPPGAMNPDLQPLIAILAALVASFVFYRLIEAPSQKLAAYLTRPGSTRP